MSRWRFISVLPLALVLTIAMACQQPPSGNPAAAKGSAADGKQLFVTRGCVACHRAPGVPEAQGSIGPNLAGIASRPKIAGTLDNTSDNMLKWLMNPPAMKPGTAMPSIGLGEEEARKLAAFMETLR